MGPPFIRPRLTQGPRFPYIPAPRPGDASSGRTNFLAVTMFAVIKTGGKQYRVAKDDVIVVEKLDGKAGDKVTFDALMSSDGKAVKVGAGAGKVSGELVETTKGDKVIVFKKRRRNTYRRKAGHRQTETAVKITAIG